MKKVFTALLLSTVSVCAAADNTQGFYVGGGGGIVKFNEGTGADEELNDAKLNSIELFGGYKYNAALGLEMRMGTNLNERKIGSNVVDGADTHALMREIAIDSYQSIYYRPELSNPQAKLYALIGYTTLDYSSTTTNTSGGTFGEADSSSSESGISYGIGIGFVVNEDVNLNFEYRQLIDEEDYEIAFMGVNFDYRF